MSLNRNKLYSWLGIACLAGYIWLYYNLTVNTVDPHSVGVCLVKHATNIPCPSCGSTRAVISLTRGDFMEAFFLNPFGYLIAFILLAAPLWILVDLCRRSQTLFDFYQKAEKFLRRPAVAIPLILLVLVNWIWNITKGL